MAIGASLRVVIGCRLPHGIILTRPNPKDPLNPEKVKLVGIHSSKLIQRDGSPAADFVTTEVDAEFWDAWKTAYHSFKPLQVGSIFEARNEQEAKIKAKEYSRQKTGFEPIDPSTMGVKTAEK